MVVAGEASMPGRLTPEQHTKIYEAWKWAYDQCAAHIASCTVPFFGYQEKEVKQCASGVLLRIGNHYFVLSAAHVLDIAQIFDIPLAIGSGVQGGPAIPLNEVKVWTNDAPPGRDPKDRDMREDDPLDIGFVLLSREIAHELAQGRRFITLDDIDVEDGLRRGCYLVYGYPNEFSVTDASLKRVATEPLRYLTELDENPKEPMDPTLEVRLKYPKNAITSSGKDVTVPSAKGLSGCGIWRIMDLKPKAQWKREDVKLAAIDHMWDGTKRYIKGTRMRHLLQAIYRRLSAVRTSMDLHLGLLTSGW